GNPESSRPRGRHRRRATLASARLKDRRLRPEALERAVDAEEEFPGGLRDRREALKRAARMTAVEHHGRSGDDDQGAANEPEPGRPWGHEGRAVHQIAEEQPVPPA